LAIILPPPKKKQKSADYDPAVGQRKTLGKCLSLLLNCPLCLEHSKSFEISKTLLPTVFLNAHGLI